MRSRALDIVTAVIRLPLLLVLCAGCNSLLGIGDFVLGGDVDATPVDADPDAPDAMVDGPAAPITALALGSDFSNGTAALLDVRTGTATLDVFAASIHGDPVLRRSNGETFVVNRGGPDHIVVLGGSPLSIVRTYQLPDGSSPQDVAASDTQLYVPDFNSTGMRVVDRATGAVATVDFDDLDVDSQPNCMSAFYTGNRVYIACGLLDGSFQPRGVGKLVVYDPFGGTVLRTIDLPFANPFGLLQPTRPADPATGALVIGTVTFSAISGSCLVQIALSNPEVATCLVSNADLGGYVQRAEADPTGETLWINSATFSGGGSLGRVMPYTLASGTLGLPISDPGQEIVDVTVCPDGYLLVSDRKAPAGVRIYHGGDGGDPIDVGEPPVYGAGVTCL